MDEFYRSTGRRYDVVTPYRLDDAEFAIVGSGCMMETGEAAVDYMRKRFGWKVGLLHLTCFRPFPAIEIVEALRNVSAVSVIERLDVPMMGSNPFLGEIKAAFADAASGTPGFPALERMPRFYGGSAGLGSRDVRSGDFQAIMENGVPHPAADRSARGGWRSAVRPADALHRVGSCAGRRGSRRARDG
jgi:pyruvate-ferredoxin/flavodoxin oxidoreductase